MQVTAGNQATRAVGDDIDRWGRRTGQCQPASGCLVHPVGEVIQAGIETVGRPIAYRRSRYIGQEPILAAIGRNGYRVPPVPKGYIQCSVDANPIGAINVTGVDQRLDKVGIGVRKRLERQFRRVNPPGQVPLIQGRLGRIDKGAAKTGHKQQGSIDEVFDARKGRRGGGTALVDHRVKPAFPIKIQPAGEAGPDHGLIVSATAVDGHGLHKSRSQDKLIGGTPTLNVQDISEPNDDRCAAGNGQGSAVGRIKVPDGVGTGPDQPDAPVALDFGDSRQVSAVIGCRSGNGQMSIRPNHDRDRERGISAQIEYAVRSRGAGNNRIGGSNVLRLTNRDALASAQCCGHDRQAAVMPQAQDMARLMHDDCEQVHAAISCPANHCCAAVIFRSFDELCVVFRRRIDEPSAPGSRNIEGNHTLRGSPQFVGREIRDPDPDAGQPAQAILVDSGGRPARNDGLQQPRNIRLFERVSGRRGARCAVVRQVGRQQFLGNRNPSDNFHSRIGRG